MKLAILVGSIFCLLIFSSPVFAQSASVSGDIRGTITDPSGAVLPKATITATAPQTGLHRTAVSDANGQFRLAGLPPAIYDVTAELPGFSTQSRKGLALAIGQTVVSDFRLQVSAVPVVLEVTDQPPSWKSTGEARRTACPNVTSPICRLIAAIISVSRC